MNGSSKDLSCKATARGDHPEPYANAQTLLHWPCRRPLTPPQRYQPMQQPLDERVASLEVAADRHEQTLARLASIAENQNQFLDRLIVLQRQLA